MEQDQGSTSNRQPSTSGERQVFTYHCLCSQLVLASTQVLSTLGRRAGQGLDKAYILPLPALPRAADDASDSDEEHKQPSAKAGGQAENSDYAILLNTTLDRKPVVVRRTDGFETRYQQRCGRCKVIVGYQLTKPQYDAGSQNGRREDVVYLLPGGLMTTSDMVEGKAMDADIEFDGVGESEGMM
jgi:hypothetical protein